MEKFLKAITPNMTVNRIVGIKDVVNLLHKCGHEISYTNIHRLKKSLANKVAKNNNRVLPYKQMVSHFNSK